MGNWGFWLVTAGISAMGLVLTAQGLQQGFMLMARVEWMDSVNAIRPYWWVRTFTGISMDIGISCSSTPDAHVARGARGRPGPAP